MSLYVFHVTIDVDGVSTWHKLDFSRFQRQILLTYGAILLETSNYTLMIIFHNLRKATLTNVTMEICTTFTIPALIAVVSILCDRRIVIHWTRLTVITWKINFTILTSFLLWLFMLTAETFNPGYLFYGKFVFIFLNKAVVVLVFIVANSAVVELSYAHYVGAL